MSSHPCISLEDILKKSPIPARVNRLDSSGPVTAWSRWNYRPGPPRLRLRCDASDWTATLYDAEGPLHQWRDPLEALQWLGEFAQAPPASEHPFKAGWLGWISYDFGRLLESIPCLAKDDLRLPLYEFQYYDQVIATDRGNVATVQAPRERSQAAIVNDDVERNFTAEGYQDAVRQCIGYIAAGDCFQVNLSQRFTLPLCEPVERIYERLLHQAGDAYGALLCSDDYAILSNSPELFLRVTPDPASRRRRIITRPIKGTRPFAEGMDRELRDSVKDAAELNMIIDLERNDLGRVCEIGTVRVTQRRAIEAHPTVYHGVASIEGTLRDEIGLVDLLRATFPGGSVTGAPKIRAMQIIEALEPTRRGPYCGAIGFVSNDGHIELSLAIRTMIAANNKIHISVGGGIVADSDPLAEYEETLVKANAMFRAVNL